MPNNDQDSTRVSDDAQLVDVGLSSFTDVSDDNDTDSTSAQDADLTSNDDDKDDK